MSAGLEAPPAPEACNRIRERLKSLYGASRGEAAAAQVWELIEERRHPISRAQKGADRLPFTQNDAVLIAYPDHLHSRGRPPLQTLSMWCRQFLHDSISVVHLLPFHPSTSYEGYAITDYEAVDPRLGSRDDIEALQRHFDIMVDLVLNHCSSSHPWFRQFLAGEPPGQGYFIEVADPAQSWLTGVHRARDLPLLHSVQTSAGLRHVWTTYSPDLVDLNWREPAVCIEFLDLLLRSATSAHRIVRLDAFVYLWKEPGTNCVNRPQNREILSLFQDVLAAAGSRSMALLPSITQVSQAENCTYFGAADLIYNLPLSALLLHTLYSHDVSALARYLAASPEPPPGRAYLNLAASHDGIGLAWVCDLIHPEAVDQLIAAARARGALLSMRRRTAGEEGGPWEINSTYFSACAPETAESPALHVDRLLATQAVVLAMRGLPALYLPLFLAGGNDLDRVQRTNDPRAINRGRFDLAAWEARQRDPQTAEARVLEGLLRLLRARRRSPAFHPEARQRVVEAGTPAVLGILRSTPQAGMNAAGIVLCMTNFSSVPARLERDALFEAAGLPQASYARDLLSGQRCDRGGVATLGPYQTAWLECRSNNADILRGTASEPQSMQGSVGHASRRQSKVERKTGANPKHPAGEQELD